jgi:hypothetical protein
MIRRAWLCFFAAAMFCLAAPLRVSNATLLDIERSFDQRIQRLEFEDPVELMGYTRGVYLEGYGAVFTNEVNLAIGSASPFGPGLTPAVLDRLRQKKLARLPELRKSMRDMLVSSATMLKTVPMEEQIVVSVSLFYLKQELTKDLPARIQMQAKRQVLLDFESGRVKADLASLIQEQVY